MFERTFLHEEFRICYCDNYYGFIGRILVILCSKFDSKMVESMEILHPIFQ